MNTNLSWRARIQNPRRKKALQIRSRVESAIKSFFGSQDFIEVRTPLLVPCPGMEPHIRPFSVHQFAPHDDGQSGPSYFLPTSPEFAMKRLLVGGLDKIFQICPAFRDEPGSPFHRNEFTMLEWYRSNASYFDIMEDTERLFEAIAIQLFRTPRIRFRDQEISVQVPWPRLKIRDLFQEKVGIDLGQCQTREQLVQHALRLGVKVGSDDNWDDLYFKIWLDFIEPHLPTDRAVFVLGYPPSQAALSVIEAETDGTRWARRFEVYAGGLELGNAFEELVDPTEQRRRFVEDMELRTRVYGGRFPKSPLDEGFLAALEEGMPPSGGIAVGVDRMVMLFADEPEIDYTFWI